MNLKDTEASRDYFQNEMNKNWDLYKKACGEILILQSKVEEMQKVLEWYADEENYKIYPHSCYEEVVLDCGERARKTLKGNQ